MFKELMQYYINCFHEKGEAALITMCNCKVPSDIILSEYKKLKPIEEFSDEEKKEYWLYAKEKYPNGDQETRLRLIKITYTIGTLL